jgi:hypothetical protein
MNERYQGDGPGGQTRKSAARAKPAAQAASSVHIKKKPQTAGEKRAARKAREREAELKAGERARKQAEKAKLESSGGEEGKEGKGAKAIVPSQLSQPKGFFGKLVAPPPNMPTSAEYKKWRKVYWVLLGIGAVAVVVAFIAQALSPQNWMFFLAVAYVPIISALVVDFRKVRPLIKAHQASAGANKSPKQLKHEQEAKERAEAIEAARKAARIAKKSSRRKVRKDTLTPGDEGPS